MNFDTIIILIAVAFFILQAISGIFRKKQEDEPVLFPEEVISPLPEELEEELSESQVEFQIVPQKIEEKVVLLEPAVPYEIKELVGIKHETELTTERLKDGIILSTIIGPPKAYKFMRRG